MPSHIRTRQEGTQPKGWYLWPTPDITLPFSEGETEDFPRDTGPIFIAKYNTSMGTRRWVARDLVSQTARNARRSGRGQYVFIIKPETFEALMTQVELGPGHQQMEAAYVLREMYFLGKTLSELDTEISARTLTRYLQKSARVLNLFGEDRDRRFKIGPVTIRINHNLLRLSRDAKLDLRKYFAGRIF